MEKALEKNKSRKDKGKKSKKDNDSLSSRGDDYTNKKKQDGNSKPRISTLKKLANSFNPPGPPPEPPARPTLKEQSISDEADQRPSLPGLPTAPVMSDVIKELGIKSGSFRRPSDNRKTSSSTPQKEEQSPRFTSSNVHQRPPAPLPADYDQQKQQQQQPQQQPEQSRRPLLPPGHENGVKRVPGAPSQTPSKPLPIPQNKSKPLPAQPRQSLQKSLSSSPHHLPTHNKQATGTPTEEEKHTEEVKPTEEAQQGPQSLKKQKPAKGAGRPNAARTKSSESITTEGGKPRSPLPRPRNRPPPPPPPGPVQESGKATSNSSLSSIDSNVSEPSIEPQVPSPRPRPLPRPRQRPEQQSAGVDQDHDVLTHESEKGVGAPRAMSPTGNKPNFSRQPSLTSRPAHPPPAIPDITKKPGSSTATASQQRVPAPGAKPMSPGPRPAPAGSRPKPPLKPHVARRPKITPPSLEPDPSLSPQVNEILQLSNQGQAKVNEILSLTNARVMDDSQNNLLEVIGELQKISLEVLESSSSLTDSLGPQARFRVRRTVTDLESKYSDIEGVMQTVGLTPNAVDMERIGKVVHSFSGALDSICSTVRATAS